MNELIVYEDDNLIICNKPVGMASQSERGFEQDLLGYVLNYRKEKKEDTYAAIINRLDKPVGGLVLLAKNKNAAAKLSAMSGEHSIEKLYYAVVKGNITEKGEYTDYLLKDGKTNASAVVNENVAGAKKAKLLYEPVEERIIDGSQFTLIRVKLLTGRHHQIRVQMAAHGHPLFGDTKYNPDYAGKRGVYPALFAYHLSFKNPMGVDKITVEVDSTL